MTRTKVSIGVVLAVLVIAGIVWATSNRALFGGEINTLGVDLSQPDAYLSTPALSRLPRDLVKAPVLREVLTEELAFYYEEHEDRLGLRGAVKRIAFEHDKTFSDQLLEIALDNPAEMAFWVDAKGAPRHWLMALTRGTLALTLQELGSVAAKDSQLSVIAPVRVGGKEVTAYALRLSPRRTLAMLSIGERVVVLSNPGLLFNAERQVDGRSLAVVAKLLASDAGTQGVYRQALGLGSSGPEHTLVGNAQLLSFGYQHFFPSLRALRLDIAPDGASLRTRIRVDGGRVLAFPSGERSPWAAMPANAAACAVVPADWAELKKVMTLAKGGPSDEAEKKKWLGALDRFEGPAAVCWYARSQLHTPLVVAWTRSNDADTAAALATFSGWLAPPSAGEVAVAATPGAMRWKREVKAPWGPHADGDATSYRPTLALQGHWVSFSPDDRLVDLALDAQARRYPNMGEAVAPHGATLAVLAPKQIAELALREAFEVLSSDQELFRQVAERRLVPRLEALKTLTTARAVVGGSADAQGWVDVDWQAVATAPAVAPNAVQSIAPASPPAASAAAGKKKP